MSADFKMPDGFHNFEKSFGALKFEQLPKIDWTNQAQIELLFPAYKREANKMLAAGMSTKHMNAAKKVDLENFKLMTPNEDAVLFQNTKLVIEQRKRSAMYGVNGVGKTVLFEAMQKGSLRGFPKHLHVHHMHELEHHEEAEKLSVYDTIINAHPLRRVLIVCQSSLQTMIEAEKDEAAKEKLSENLKFIEAQMRSISCATAAQRIEQMLRVLGFDEQGEKRLLSELSGGLRMRVALASAFFIDPELLLLDEPTNHLDFPSVLWLENRLRGYKGAFVVVTHDRQLLENVCTSVMLLQDKKISYYNSSFAQFEKTKWKEDESKDQMIDKFMARNRKVDPTSMLAKQKKEYAEWQEKHRAHRVMLAGKFTFKPPPFLKGVPEGTAPEDVSLINMDKLTFSYNPETSPFIFENPISFNCNLGTRVGVMGPNGAGKSTFLKLLTSKLKPTTGEITSHPDYRLAYFGQHSTKELDMEHTPKEFMCKSFPEEKAGVLVGHLSKTSINSDAANTRMKNLSYSQRSCVIFAKLTYHPPHVLIMDEPTNFLDLDSVDSLIAATNKFKGALLVVTHSRDFLKRCATTFLSIVPGRFLTFKSMKEAESSTYSFIAAMEDGERINTKNLIVDNPSAGINDMTKKEKKKAEDQTDADGNLVMSSINLDGSKKKKGGMTAAQRKREEEAEAKKVKDEKKAKKAKARAARKTDWKVGDTPFAMVGKGKNAGYQQATVTKVTGMGVIISVNGKNVMVDANKLFEVNPSPAGKASGGASRGGRGGGRGGRVTGGSSTARGPAAKQDQGRQSGARGGRGGARGGRGGRGGRGQGNQTQRTSTNNQTGGGNRNARRQGNQQQPRGKVRSGSERN